MLLFEPRARAGGAGHSVGAATRYLLPASVAPGGGHLVVRRVPPLPLCVGGIVRVRASVCAR